MRAAAYRGGVVGSTDGSSRRASAREAVLRGFFDLDGRLVQWPAKHSRRLLALDVLAQLFEPGLRYDETQVNAALREAVGGRVDVVTARRYLVDAEMLLRADGVYWRAGGTVAL